MTDDALATFVELVRGIVGRAAASGPLPRGWAHLGLDHPSPTSLDQLAGLARHGIFRKYEQVLILAGGLGAAARWAVAKLGCTTISTTPSEKEAELGGALTAGAGLADAVSHLACANERLAVRDRAVTHVWAMESLGTLADPERALAEARRVVRPGGHLAVLESVADAGAEDVGGRVLRSEASWIESIRAAGFVDLVSARADDASDQVNARVSAARENLLAALAECDDASLTRLAESLRLLTSARAAGRVRLVRILGRRP
jgi:SAM-dependent methyltransferase